MKDLALNKLIGALVAVVIAFSPCADARQDNSVGDSGITPLFASHAPLKVTIEAP